MLSCKKENLQLETQSYQMVYNDYATGFHIVAYEHYKVIEVTKAFPDGKDTLRYALIDKAKENVALLHDNYDQIIRTPIDSIVVTSTTHIPSLEMLNEGNSLVGFPNLEYVSSTLSRKRIQQNLIKELGNNDAINTEVLIDLHPDAVVTFGIDGQNISLEVAQKAGIPILYNGDWVEQNPLGKAEWIKFFGALYQKEKQADSIFKQIEKEYIATRELAQKIDAHPTVLSGAMYKDIWYLPKGESWAAQLIADAGGDYLWSQSTGSGSLSLSIETVLNQAQEADFWIAPGQYTSYRKLEKDNPVNSKFNAFQGKNIFTFAAKKGETGGLLYYELAPNRPDLVLKDMVYYLHPGSMPNYEPYFFTPLED